MQTEPVVAMEENGQRSPLTPVFEEETEGSTSGSNAGSLQDQDQEDAWEDWDEDQKVALGRSHFRTLGGLEDTRNNSPHAQEQIQPSPQNLESQEQAAKKRSYMNMSPTDNGYPYSNNESTYDSEIVMTNKPQKRKRGTKIAASVCLVAIAILTIATIVVVLFGPAGTGEETFWHQMHTKFSNMAVGSELGASFLNINSQRKDQMILPDYLAKAFQDTKKDWDPPSYESLYSRTNYNPKNVQPVYWYLPRSGERAVAEIMSYCLMLTTSSSMAAGHQIDRNLFVMTAEDNIGHFVNVDTSTLDGIQRAENLGLIESRLAQAIVTPYFSEASSLFRHKATTGRIFSMVRHPVDREVSRFYHQLSLPQNHPDLIPGITSLKIHQYVESKFVLENMLTRSLANVTDITHDINELHIDIAKQILEKYVVIGMFEEFEASMGRFHRYFGWPQYEELDTCQRNFITALHFRENYTTILPNSFEFKTLHDRNWADVEVYQYARMLFQRQASLIAKSS